MSIDTLLDSLRAKLDPEGRILDENLRELASEVLDWDDDTVPRVLFGAPASEEDLEQLQEWVEETFGAPLPGDLLAFLRRHDGMNAASHAPEDWPADFEEATLDEPKNCIKSVAMLSDEIRQVLQFVEAGLAPEGILPIHDPYGYEPLIQTALLLDPALPDAGKIIAFDAKDLPSHRRASELENHSIVADSFEAWLEAWIASGFDPDVSAFSDESDEESEERSNADRAVVGDIIRIDGKGFHWVVGIREEHDTRWLGSEMIATDDHQPPPQPVRGQRTHWVHCQVIDESERARILPLIDPEILAIFPSDRPKEAQFGGAPGAEPEEGAEEVPDGFFASLWRKLTGNP